MYKNVIRICAAVTALFSFGVLPAATGPPDEEARRQFADGNYPAAAAALEAHLSLHPDDVDARILLGWSRYRLGRFAAAAQSFRTALGQRPADPDAANGLAYTRLQSGEPLEAVETFRSVLKAHPDHDDALHGLVLAASRAPDQVTGLDEILNVARDLARRNPDDSQLTGRVDLLELYVADGEYRPLPPADGSAPIEVVFHAGDDYLQVRDDAGGWRPIFIKGFNLGTALPGRFPTEFPTDVETYAGWLDTMADLGANVVRLYTLLPPAFYRALATHNADPDRRRLLLIQGIWALLPPRHDFSDPVYLAEVRAEVARVVDAVHGNLVLAPRPGHASGRYDADVSADVLALLVSREWEPFAVVDYNALYPDRTSWSGRWFEVEGGRAMEVWVAELCEHAVAYEASRYRVIRPVSFANWPTLDPLEHPTEADRAEEDLWRRRHELPVHGRLRDAAWEDDRVTLDATLIRPRPEMRAGFFAAYHIYPNYPDFMNLEPGFADGRDARGPSRYAAYLDALKGYHGRQPVLVAEFGISTSRGTAHLQPQGWHHGGLDERRQGELVARMLHNIRDARYAGGIVFSFMDEWFKGTWSVAPLEVPAERRRLWFNAESPEQSYGILAARPAGAAVRLDGDPSDWDDAQTLAGSDEEASGWAALREIRATADEGYLYLLLRTGGAGTPLDVSQIAYRIAIDTYDPRRGERALPPPGPARVPTGVEFIVELGGPGHSRMLVTAPYDPYGGQSDRALVSPVDGTGTFVPLMLETNRERFARDGRRFPPQVHERGALRWGSLDPGSDVFDTRTDVALGERHGVLELRLPWALLNVADPSTHRVLHGPRDADGSPGTTETPGFQAYAFAVDPRDPEREPLDRLPAGPTLNSGYRWRTWEQPSYRLELKQGAGAIREAMKSLSDPIEGEQPDAARVEVSHAR